MRLEYLEGLRVVVVLLLDFYRRDVVGQWSSPFSGRMTEDCVMGVLRIALMSNKDTWQPRGGGLLANGGSLIHWSWWCRVVSAVIEPAPHGMAWHVCVVHECHCVYSSQRLVKCEAYRSTENIPLLINSLFLILRA